MIFGKNITTTNTTTATTNTTTTNNNNTDQWYMYNPAGALEKWYP